MDMAFDHQLIMNLCHEWLQKRVQEHPLGFSLASAKISLRELQNLYEAILGIKLDRRNFRKKILFDGCSGRYARAGIRCTSPAGQTLQV